MTAVQTLCLVLSGYLLSQLLLAVGGHERFVTWLLARSQGRVSGILLGIILGSALLSLIVPNALTVLAVIPLVTRLRRHPPAGLSDRAYATLLALAVVWGANLGGVGTLIGSPANLYLLVNLELFQVPGRERLHFLSWLVFGVPLTLLLALGFWAGLGRLERPAFRARVEGGLGDPPPATARQRVGAVLAAVWAAAWVFLLGLGFAWPARLGPTGAWVKARVLGSEIGFGPLDAGALAVTLVVALGLFAWPVSDATGRRPLLAPRDLFRELPIKGLILGAAVLVFLVVVARSGLVRVLADAARAAVPGDLPAWVLLGILVTVTIFATEVLSNTAVATVLFPVALALGQTSGNDPVVFMLGVSLASTCAFMSPVATPVNALAFAGVGGVSLGTFLRNGLVANLLGAVVITAWLALVVPLVLGWF